MCHNHRSSTENNWAYNLFFKIDFRNQIKNGCWGMGKNIEVL